MFSRAKQGLLVINRQAKSGSEQEKKVARNVVSSLAITLQDLSVDFRKAQSSYLKSKRRGGGGGEGGGRGGGEGGGGGKGRGEGEINQNVHVYCDVKGQRPLKRSNRPHN